MLVSRRDRALAAASPLGDAGGRAHLEGRTAETVIRIARHEAGHALVGRALGSIIEVVTVVPVGDFAGQCLRRAAGDTAPLHLRSEVVIDVLAVAARIGPPALGESRVDCAQGVERARVLCRELLAGSTAEIVLDPSMAPLRADHNVKEAEALARTASLAPAAFLDACREEARVILESNRDVLAALAERLSEIGTLVGAEVDQIIGLSIAKRQAELRAPEAYGLATA